VVSGLIFFHSVYNRLALYFNRVREVRGLMDQVLIDQLWYKENV
jgi:hypothetical protein